MSYFKYVKSDVDDNDLTEVNKITFEMFVEFRNFADIVHVFESHHGFIAHLHYERDHVDSRDEISRRISREDISFLNDLVQQGLIRWVEFGSSNLIVAI